MYIYIYIYLLERNSDFGRFLLFCKIHWPESNRGYQVMICINKIVLRKGKYIVNFDRWMMDRWDEWIGLLPPER